MLSRPPFLTTDVGTSDFCRDLLSLANDVATAECCRDLPSFAADVATSIPLQLMSRPLPVVATAMFCQL